MLPLAKNADLENGARKEEKRKKEVKEKLRKEEIKKTEKNKLTKEKKPSQIKNRLWAFGYLSFGPPRPRFGGTSTWSSAVFGQRLSWQPR